MKKPIVQLIIFLLIVVFSTFILLRFNSFNHNNEAHYPSGSVNITLPQNMISLMDFSNEESNSFATRNLNIRLYYLLGKGKVNLAKGDYKKAENELRTLLLFYPDNKTILSLLGGVLYTAGNYEQAHDIFLIMLENNPNDPLARENMGLALEKQQKYSEAIEEFLRASLLRPESASMYLHLAGLYSIVYLNRS